MTQSTNIQISPGVYVIINAILLYVKVLYWPSQSKCRTSPSPQGFLMLSFCNSTYPFYLPPFYLLVSTDLFSISIILSFQKCHINEIIPYVTFWDWLFFFTQHNSLESFKLFCVSITHYFLLLSSIPR